MDLGDYQGKGDDSRYKEMAKGGSLKVSFNKYNNLSICNMIQIL